jgi:hypothetical protein
MAQLHGYFPTDRAYVCVFDDALVGVGNASSGRSLRHPFGDHHQGQDEKEARIEELGDRSSSEFADELGSDGEGFGRIALDEVESVEIGPPSQSLEKCDLKIHMTGGKNWWAHLREEERNRAANLLSPLLGDRLNNMWDAPPV